MDDIAGPITTNREPDESALLWAMRTHGLEWRDAGERTTIRYWRWPFLLNASAGDAITSVQIQAMGAARIEKNFAAVAEDGFDNNNLTAKYLSRHGTWLGLGRKFARNFHQYIEE